MGGDERTSLLDDGGRHRHLRNLSVHDASIFPTSVGANPQVSIYAQALRMSESLAASLART